MENKNTRWTALSVGLLGLLLVGFSDTAQAQSVTLSGTGITANALSITVQHGGVSPTQVVHVATSDDPSGSVSVVISATSPWIHILEAPTGNNNINTTSTGLDLHLYVDATNLMQGTRPAR